MSNMTQTQTQTLSEAIVASTKYAPQAEATSANGYEAEAQYISSYDRLVINIYAIDRRISTSAYTGPIDACMEAFEQTAWGKRFADRWRAR